MQKGMKKALTPYFELTNVSNLSLFELYVTNKRKNSKLVLLPLGCQGGGPGTVQGCPRQICKHIQCRQDMNMIDDHFFH